MELIHMAEMTKYLVALTDGATFTAESDEPSVFEFTVRANYKDRLMFIAVPEGPEVPLRECMAYCRANAFDDTIDHLQRSASLMDAAYNKLDDAFEFLDLDDVYAEDLASYRERVKDIQSTLVSLKLDLERKKRTALREYSEVDKATDELLARMDREYWA